MQKRTANIIEALLRSDDTVDKILLNKMMTLAVGGQNDDDRLVCRTEAAHMLGRCPRSLARLVERGALTKITFPNHVRSAGFRLSEIRKLITGK
jgi:hypothetical protein